MLLLLLLLKPTEGHSVLWCGTYANLVARLWAVYKETEEVWMLGADGFVYELFVNLKTNSWTFVVVYPDKTRACALEHGTSYTSRGIAI